MCVYGGQKSVYRRSSLPQAIRGAPKVIPIRTYWKRHLSN